MSKKDAKEVIHMLREAYAEMDFEEQCKLWDILTALRGPDNGRDDVKNATTAIIRAAVFGAEAGTQLAERAFVKFQDETEYVEMRTHLTDSLEKDKLVDTQYHFYDHAIQAFRALGLSWLQSNEEVKEY